MAQNIKRYRKIAHLTQEQLAERVETSTNYIGTIETGKKFPSPQMIERIAEALHIESPQLFQADIDFNVQNQVNLEDLKKSLMENIKNAVDRTIKKI
ncbi:MAG: helix-turn-helix transcriptional regulator [Spirochaetaceae bacterium]|nr:helix-turn-helix transcriptional regulator [Spirochaetaceae bacterium]